MFSLLAIDVDVLIKIRTEFQSDVPIRFVRGDKYVTFCVTSKRMADDLRRIGLTNHKTFDLNIHQVLEHVPESLRRDFLRGMFDGDGSICIYKYPYFRRHTYHLGFTGLKEVCEYVEDVFM